MELGCFKTTEKGLSHFILSPLLYIPFLLTQEAFENRAVTLFRKYTAKIHKSYFGKHLALSIANYSVLLIYVFTSKTTEMFL